MLLQVAVSLVHPKLLKFLDLYIFSAEVKTFTLHAKDSLFEMRRRYKPNLRGSKANAPLGPIVPS